MGVFVRSRRRSLFFAFAVVWSVVMASAAPAQGDDAAAFYKGKVIRLLVGYGPGGGYDAYARLLAPHLERKTGATVVVENRPGGGGLVALNRLVTVKPDGLTLMIINGQAAALAQLLGQEGVRYDLTKITWLGRLSAEARVLMWSAKSPFQTLADGRAASRRIKWAATGKAGTLAMWVAFASEALDLDSLIITGYKGSKAAALAAMGGEVDGISVSASSAKKYARGNKMIAAVVLARERSPLLADVQTVFEMISLSPDKAWWIDYASNLAKLGRALATTPGVPENRAAFMRKAIEAIVTDPAVIAEARKKGRLFRYASADRLGAFVTETLTSLDDANLSRVKSVIFDKYY